MTPHEEITAYLEKQEKTFDEGFSIFRKYSRNKSLEHFLERKRDMAKLAYELRKLLGSKIKDSTVSTLNLIKSQPAPAVNPVVPPGPDGATFRYLRFQKINPEELPADVRRIYDQIAEAYKMQRTCHEKMKLAKTDKTRADWRKKVVEFDDVISSGWNGIDAFVAGSDTIPDTANAGNITDVSKEINACRSYISRAINDVPKLSSDKREKRIKETQQRLSRLAALKTPITSETRDRLIEAGIIDLDYQVLLESA
ncbi:MAG TPA: hypothetical protein PKH58_01320 [Paludibacteraceae bacterium]|nr:hypothetical protein [Paludibacteraceae bacterium]